MRCQPLTLIQQIFLIFSRDLELHKDGGDFLKVKPRRVIIITGVIISHDFIRIRKLKLIFDKLIARQLKTHLAAYPELQLYAQKKCIFDYQNSSERMKELYKTKHVSIEKSTCVVLRRRSERSLVGVVLGVHN